MVMKKFSHQIYHGPFTGWLIHLLIFLINQNGTIGEEGSNDGGSLNNILGSGGIPGIELSMPPSHTALSGDLHIQITSSSFPPLVLQLSRLEGNVAQPLTTFPVYPEASALARNNTLVKIPCGYFSKGGVYYVLVKKKKPIGSDNSTASTVTNNSPDSHVITRSLDVRWPMPQLSVTPEHIQTYPEREVSAILEFPEVMCPPVVDNLASALPEFWLELRYCGHSLLTCDTSYDSDKNKTAVLYSEQVRGFPGRRVLTMRCELFGLAGHYGVFLMPTTPTPALPHTAAYVKADWSEQFVFNVHARSIFPCDVHSGGINVLFQYPSCILATGDRVRLFARLRANVASLAPPTSLEYIAEQRVNRGQHSLHFDCDLFTERYVEYCFVYVSQAITGAVADVRMDCVPTLPVTEMESGGWGPWSPWTPCSTTCIGGTRSRYRFCDSPPPRYGAKFCEGRAVETEKCGTSIGKSWECFMGNGIASNDIAAEIPEVQAEVGPYCRCGCVVHLGRAKPKRLLATSSQSCPGRTFWLIQSDENCVIQFKVEQFHLPCGTQWLKVRDGTSLSSNLLADLSGSPDATPTSVNSTGPNLLLEFYSEEITIGGQLCGGGFLAHATQIGNPKQNVTVIPIAQSVGIVPAVALRLTAVHIAAVFFLSGLLIATALLGMQYLFRYRKYHVAQAEDQDSLADPSASNASLPLTTRASSNATLLSEVISLTRLRPHMKSRNKHSRLRESVDCDVDQELEQECTLAKEEESISLGSTATLTQQDTLTSALPTTATNSEMEESTLTASYSLPNSPHEHHQPATRSGSSSAMSTLKRSISQKKDAANDKDMDREVERHLLGSNYCKDKRNLSNVSTTTLTNGCYSPAASIISTATIRSTNAKETKEKRNRERLLAGPNGSDFSIAAPDLDLEMDYYDYNVTNAGAAPGSYLGMDPAFLVWIPPLDESGEILPNDERNYHEMEDIRPRVYIDPGSNTESPEEEILLPKDTTDKRKRSVSEETPKGSPILRPKNRVGILNAPRSKPNEREIQPLIHGQQSNNLGNKKIVTIQLHDYKSASIKLRPNSVEKETKVEKSPSIDSNILDEIKFADEEDEDENINEENVCVQKEIPKQNNVCNIDVSYQDSNILSSSS